MIPEKFIKEILTDYIGKIDKAKYRIGDVYKIANISKTENLLNGSIAVYFQIEQGQENVIITEISLINTAGETLFSKTTNLLIQNIQQGALHRVVFSIKERG